MPVDVVACGLTQAEAAAAGVSREAVSVLENRRRSARLETLNAVLFELGVELGFEPAFVRRAQPPPDASEGTGVADLAAFVEGRPAGGITAAPRQPSAARSRLSRSGTGSAARPAPTAGRSPETAGRSPQR